MTSSSWRMHRCRLACIAGLVFALLLSGRAGAKPPALGDEAVGFATTGSELPGDMDKRVAACTACHGTAGAQSARGVYFPRIAGKPAGYLYNQLLNFRDGRRNYPLMAHLLENMSDAYLQDIARYFASLQVPHPLPVPLTLPSNEMEARARELVTQGNKTLGIPPCAQCHSAALTGTPPFVPSLLGLPRDYLVAQLGAWRTGQRRAQLPDCMAHVASHLTSEDIAALAAWLAAQPVPVHGQAAVDTPGGAWPLPCGGSPH
jgi:cytochrome c553